MFAPKRWKKALPVAAIALSMGLFTACSSGGSTGATPSDGGAESGSTPEDGPTLVMWAGSQTPLVANFNPYAPTVLHAALGGIYQPLYFYNKAEPTPPVPLVAESVEWAEDGMYLDIHIRPGIEWNDGQPVTTEDIIFSFTNEGVQMDYVDSAEALDDNTVRLNFNTPAYTNEFSLLGATYIVPKHVFGEVDDLVTFANTDNPVGTGPFMLENFTDAAYTAVANPNYWDEGHPAINRVQWLGIDGNASGESMFKTGQMDYATMFIPHPDQLTDTGLGYVKVSSPNPVVIMTCSNADLGCTGAQTDVAFRHAFDVVIDRDEINEKAFYGLSTPASPTFAKPGRDEQWMAEGVPEKNPTTADPEEAKKIMEDGGWTLGADGIYEKDGQRAAVTLVSVEGWGDNNAASELIVAQAKKGGLEVTHQTVTLDQFTDMRLTGEYEMVFSALVGTPISDPYTIYRNCFTTSFTQPVGTSLEPNQTNYARYSNEAVDEAVKAAAMTNDPEEKAAAYATIQENIYADMPYISMFHGGNQTFYNQTEFDGWPTESDLYAFPASWDGISAAYILSQLTYK